MYRPTVRYDEAYRSYVDSLFHATTLDRNQIIRLALFIAGHSKEYAAILEQYKRGDVPTLPSAKWTADQSRLWLEQAYQEKIEEGKDVNANDRREEAIVAADVRDGGGAGETGASEGRIGAVSSERISIKNQGGVIFTFN